MEFFFYDFVYRRKRLHDNFIPLFDTFIQWGKFLRKFCTFNIHHFIQGRIFICKSDDIFLFVRMNRVIPPYDFQIFARGASNFMNFSKNDLFFFFQRMGMRGMRMRGMRLKRMMGWRRRMGRSQSHSFIVNIVNILQWIFPTHCFRF